MFKKVAVTGRGAPDVAAKRVPLAVKLIYGSKLRRAFYCKLLMYNVMTGVVRLSHGLAVTEISA